MAALAVVRDLRDVRTPVSAEELEQFESDALAGFVLARASAGLTDGTIRGDVGHLEQVRTWFGRPLWDMEPSDADAYFGKTLRNSPSGTRLARSQALTTYFAFLELRHKVELHRMTGRVGVRMAAAESDACDPHLDVDFTLIRCGGPPADGFSQVA
ncbi:hypothetical protein [Streptomyces sp. NPDC046942]|uniref:hypothetical protein n=1 Tax=Streptomyces sp. NPDC046942 TaxID=3155137 RepID=UPI0034092951